MKKSSITQRLPHVEKPCKYVLKKLSIGLVSVTVASSCLTPLGAVLAEEPTNPPAQSSLDTQTTYANDGVVDVPTTIAPTTQEQPQTTEVPTTTQETTVATQEEAVRESAPTVDQARTVVRIHYKGNPGDGRKYYAWVWEDTARPEGSGHWVEMQPGKDDFVATIQADAGRKKFKYLIATGTDLQGDKTKWESLKNSSKVFGENNDFSAPANEITDTDIYHSADWYSQFLNVQSKEFDAKYAYKDREAGGAVVGKEGALGVTLQADGSAKFNLWAPTATKVSLNIYASADENAALKQTIEMKRGTDANPADHTQNTIGLWTVTVSADQLGGMSLDRAAYDYTISAPNSYFIQKTVALATQQGDGSWKAQAYNYTNSATGDKLESKVENKQVISQPSIKDIAAFYVGEDRQVQTQDPYSVATVRNGKRSVVLDPSKVGTPVTNTNNKRVSSTSQMSVLETNVRDFSIAENSGINPADKGNFLGVVQEGTKNTTTGQRTGLDYLKYLGVNYIQMMPLNDFETVPELDKDSAENNQISEPEADGQHKNQQNWGYDPKNYNVPEGSYATDPANPTNRIEELKTMMQKLHNAGINVNLDVVYNHLYDGQKNPFEYTVPGYYYAVNEDGAMNNDVGVGNAVRSNSEMMRQYIVNSVVYWAKEYGMDGFRFDAMSDLDTTTLTAVRGALDAIDKNIVTYGEGWDSMGNYLAKDGDIKASIGNASKLPTYGFFDSQARDAIAGSAYGEDTNPPGFVNRKDSPKGESKHLKDATAVAKALLGGLDRQHDPYLTASQQLNYVEVHDGMTLSDLLRKYNPSDSEDDHKKRVELATAMSALSQGIHFSQHGQEFLRAKDGSHNTYNGGDKLNQINWDLTKTNIDVVNFSKSLFTLRQSDSAFHLSDYGILKEQMKVTNAQNESGIVTYELKRANGAKYLVVFNNNMSDNHRLVLGENNYYYGAEKTRGQINDKNDFSKVFIVTTNAQSLYGKIGQYNGTKTIDLDPLSATVLYLGNKPTITSQQTVDYEKDASQKVTALTVKADDPEKMFGYETSGIATNSEKDLGHAKNVLTSLQEAQKEAVYYATDAKDNLITTDKAPALAEDGTPIDTPEVKWVLKGKEKVKPKTTTAQSTTTSKATTTSNPTTTVKPTTTTKSTTKSTTKPTTTTKSTTKPTTKPTTTTKSTTKSTTKPTTTTKSTTKPTTKPTTTTKSTTKPTTKPTTTTKSTTKSTTKPTTTTKSTTKPTTKPTTKLTTKVTTKPSVPKQKDTVKPVYRLYHEGLKVHLYTTDINERDTLKKRGWRYEGEAWKTSTKAGEPVYRLYHSGLRVHLYTKDANEYKVLGTRGWKQEGIAYRSHGDVKVYRLYHGGIKKHHYTKDVNEYNTLGKRGWKQEGIAWYSEK